MNEPAWNELCARFPREPAGFRMVASGVATLPGAPVLAHARPVLALAFSPDSRSVAVSGGGMIPGPVDVRVFDVRSRERRLACHGHVMGVFNLAFDPRTSLLASASHDYSVILWDLERRGAIFLCGGEDASVSRRAAGFLGKRVVVADGMTWRDERAELATLDLETAEHRVLLTLEHGQGVQHLALLPAEGLAVIATGDMRDPGGGSVRVIDLDGREQARWDVPEVVYDLAAIDAGRVVVTMDGADDTTQVVAADPRSGTRTAARTLGDAIGADVALSPGRDHVAVAYDRGVELCAADTLAPFLRLDLDDEHACGVAWSPDGAWIAVGTVEQSLRLFHAGSGREHLD